MNSKGFVKAIELIASSALTGLLKTIAKPPGKSPAPNLVRISELYRSLSDKDKQIFSDALELAARQSINNFHSNHRGQTFRWHYYKGVCYTKQNFGSRD